MSNSFSLEGKTVLVTGASSGIGRACAVECSRSGATVICMGRNQDRLAETMELLSPSHHHRIAAIELTDYNKIDEFFAGLNKEKIRIDGFVHSAGISTTMPLRMAKPDVTREYFEVNVNAAMNMCRWVSKSQFVPETGSSMVLLSSVMSVVGEAGKSTYSLTKGALLAAARSLAVELAGNNVRVNCISPGVVETPMSGGSVYSKNEEAFERIRKLHPLGIGKPEDVACGCIYLLSEASRWITGTNLIIDGGYTAR
jgi:NAD(P)-dependent dehydrogenase (short-subunit alcohol dehydrogenase family)